MNAEAGSPLSPLRQHGPALVILLLLAFALRAYQLGESLWIDELHTAWTVADGVGQIAPRAKIGNQSPLYFFGVWLSTSVFGQHEIGLRLPSLIAGLLLVPTVYGLVRRWSHDRISATLGATLVALDPHLVFYSQEARPYAWVQLLAVVHVSALWQTVVGNHRRWRLLFVASGVLLFYLHYTSALILVADVAIFFVLAWRADDIFFARWRSFLAELAFIAIATIPAWSHLREIAARRANWETISSTPSLWDLLEIFPLLRYVAVPFAAVVLAWLRRQPLPHKRPLWLAVAWLATPTAFAWLLANAEIAQVFMYRYLCVAAVAPIVLSAICVSVLATRRIRIALSVIVVSLAIFFSGYVQQFRIDGRILGDRNEPWREAIQLLNDDGSRDMPILLASNLIEDRLLANRENEPLSPAWADYFRFPLRCLYRLHAEPVIEPVAESDGQFFISQETENAIRQSHGVRVVVRGRALFQPTRRWLATWLRQRDLEVVAWPWQELGNLSVEKITLREVQSGRRSTMMEPASNSQ